jgi:hypothetical protein
MNGVIRRELRELCALVGEERDFTKLRKLIEELYPIFGR